MSVSTAVFRLPKPTYLVLIFLVFGITPLALYGGPGEGSPARISALTLLYLIPVLAAVFIARTSTRVDSSGIRVSAIFGSRMLDWTQVRGLSVTGRNVYAVTEGGSLRLPCVRQRDLTAIAQASGGALPELPEPMVKSAPGRRR
jgi:Bacterial PH domain